MRQYRIREEHLEEVAGFGFEAAYGFRGARCLLRVRGTPKLAGRYVALRQGFRWKSAQSGGAYTNYVLLRPLSDETLAALLECITLESAMDFDRLVEEHAERHIDLRKTNDRSPQYDPHYEPETITIRPV